MSKIHVLTADNKGNYRVIVHDTMPAGNNSAGNSWKNVWLQEGAQKDPDTGNVTSKLVEGTNPGNISIAEKAQVVDGTLIEFEFTIKVESGDSSQASINSLVNIEITMALALLQKKFKYYGYTQG